MTTPTPIAAELPDALRPEMLDDLIATFEGAGRGHYDLMRVELPRHQWAQLAAHLRTALTAQASAAERAVPANPWLAALEIRMAQGWKLKGDRIPVLYTDTINGDGVGRDDLWLCTTAALAAAPAQPAHAQPIDMVLHCPKCGLQHIDRPEVKATEWENALAAGASIRVEWSNPPHRSHLCHGCGHIWRPADVPTNGVAAVKTTGKADSPIAARAPADSVTAPAGGAVAGPGWQMVPVKPTPEMLRAGDQKTWVLPALDCWRAMLAAAPAPLAHAADSVLEDAVGLINDIDTHMRSEWSAGRLPAACWPLAFSDRIKTIIAARKQGANHD